MRKIKGRNAGVQQVASSSCAVNIEDESLLQDRFTYLKRVRQSDQLVGSNLYLPLFSKVVSEVVE